MHDLIIEWDYWLFYIINSVWANPFLDAVMPWMRNKFLWMPLYLFIIVFFLRNYKIQGVYVLIYLAIVVLLCDQLSGTLKLLVDRKRPCQDDFWLEHPIRLLVGCGKSMSFPSNHAANHFGVATFLGVVLWRNSSLVLLLGFLWAGVISFAQVYVGVHYPLDVVGGAILGFLIGSGMAKMLRRHLS